jgi:DNA mismatch endonuclease (patch repair protein)
MPDVVDKQTRSRMMAGIRCKDTLPERIVRRALHRDGLRYRLHYAGLPGKPDIIFPSRKAVVFIHGCFWHGHSCPLFKMPSTRPAFWSNKIGGNRNRDRVVAVALKEMGWRVIVVWECALKGKSRKPLDQVTGIIVRWVRHGVEDLEVRGLDYAAG